MKPTNVLSPVFFLLSVMAQEASSEGRQANLFELSQFTESQALERCRSDLLEIDENGDMSLDRNEYAAFLQLQSGNQMRADYNDLPFRLIAVYLSAACWCDVVDPNDNQCCLNGQDHIPLDESLSPLIDPYLQFFCVNVQQGLAAEGLDITVPPTLSPTLQPTSSPTTSPSVAPTSSPSTTPTSSPSDVPSDVPSEIPTSQPSQNPTIEPTVIPTIVFSDAPSETPTVTITEMPSFSPTVSTELPSVSPSIAASYPPTNIPTLSPTEATPAPTTLAPTVTPVPTLCVDFQCEYKLCFPCCA